MTTSAAPPPLPAAVLWDFDGTLVDTEPIWVQAQYALADQAGVRWSEADAARLVGNSLIDSGRYIVGVYDEQLGTSHGWTPESIVTAMVDQVSAQIADGDILWRPGAAELLESCAAAGVRCALVSASYRQVLDTVVKRLPADTFATVVAGDDVANGKPHPEPYLTAASRLQVDPADCIVLEDSVPGATSGNAAGAFVVGIQHLVALPAAPRRAVIDTLAGLDVAGLAAIAAVAVN